MTVTALLVSTAFVAGGASGWIFAFGRGWRACDHMWQAEWDARRELDRATWVASEALGRDPTESSNATIDQGPPPVQPLVRGQDGSLIETGPAGRGWPRWGPHNARVAVAEIVLATGEPSGLVPVPAEQLIAELHAERGEVWVRRDGGVHLHRPGTDTQRGSLRVLGWRPARAGWNTPTSPWPVLASDKSPRRVGHWPVLADEI